MSKVTQRCCRAFISLANHMLPSAPLPQYSGQMPTGSLHMQAPSLSVSRPGNTPLYLYTAVECVRHACGPQGSLYGGP